MHISKVSHVKAGELFFLGLAPWHDDGIWAECIILTPRYASGKWGHEAVGKGGLHCRMPMMCPAIILKKAGEGEWCKSLSYLEGTKAEHYFVILCGESTYYAHFASLWQLEDFKTIGLQNGT